jgi:hypothetical protein
MGEKSGQKWEVGRYGWITAQQYRREYPSNASGRSDDELIKWLDTKYRNTWRDENMVHHTVNAQQIGGGIRRMSKKRRMPKKRRSRTRRSRTRRQQTRRPQTRMSRTRLNGSRKMQRVRKKKYSRRKKRIKRNNKIQLGGEAAAIPEEYAAAAAARMNITLLEYKSILDKFFGRTKTSFRKLISENENIWTHLNSFNAPPAYYTALAPAPGGGAKLSLDELNRLLQHSVTKCPVMIDGKNWWLKRDHPTERLLLRKIVQDFIESKGLDGIEMPTVWAFKYVRDDCPNPHDGNSPIITNLKQDLTFEEYRSLCELPEISHGLLDAYEYITTTTEEDAADALFRASDREYKRTYPSPTQTPWTAPHWIKDFSSRDPLTHPINTTELINKIEQDGTLVRIDGDTSIYTLPDHPYLDRDYTIRGDDVSRYMPGKYDIGFILLENVPMWVKKCEIWVGLQLMYLLNVFPLDLGGGRNGVNFGVTEEGKVSIIDCEIKSGAGNDGFYQDFRLPKGESWSEHVDDTDHNGLRSARQSAIDGEEGSPGWGHMKRDHRGDLDTFVQGNFSWGYKYEYKEQWIFILYQLILEKKLTAENASEFQGPVSVMGSYGSVTPEELKRLVFATDNVEKLKTLLSGPHFTKCTIEGQIDILDILIKRDA